MTIFKGSNIYLNICGTDSDNPDLDNIPPAIEALDQKRNTIIRGLFDTEGSMATMDESNLQKYINITLLKNYLNNIVSNNIPEVVEFDPIDNLKTEFKSIDITDVDELRSTTKTYVNDMLIEKTNQFKLFLSRSCYLLL